MSAGEISPSSARCMFVVQTVRTKSTVFGESGRTDAKGKDASVASTKRLGCSVQFAAPVFVIVSWFVSLVNIRFPSTEERNESQRNAASLFLQVEKMAFDSSP